MNKRLEKQLYKLKQRKEARVANKLYMKRYFKFSFESNKCIDEKQYEAVITRWYHTIEKGLAYTNYKVGFGVNNLKALLTVMENYVADGYSCEAFFYKTALSTLEEYRKKNFEFGYENQELNERISKLPGSANEAGGIVILDIPRKEEIQNKGYEDFVKSRHSMRSFSKEPLNIEVVKKAISLAQYTPSACNRQGWRARIIQDKELMKKVLSNQNGNQGFGHEFAGLILVTADIRYFNRDREVFQAFIDGGMYAQSILNALHYENIASVPLSASLRMEQEYNVRKLMDLHEAEILIMFIGIGNYPEVCQTTKSERRNAYIEIL